MNSQWVSKSAPEYLRVKEENLLKNNNPTFRPMRPSAAPLNGCLMMLAG